MRTILCIFLLFGSCLVFVAGQFGSVEMCDASTCIEQVRVQNIFLRPEDASQLTEPVICDESNPNSLFQLMRCWRQQCGPDFGRNPTVVNAVQTILDVCQGGARFKLLEATQKCRIFYPSTQARPLPPDLINQCILPGRRQSQSPRIEARITNFLSKFQTLENGLAPPLADDPYMAYDLSGSSFFAELGYRPIVGTSVSESNWDDSTLTSNWQWPSLNTAATSSPNFHLMFPQSTLPYITSGISQNNQQSLTLCLQVSDLMDCTLARTCSPDLGQVMKALAMVYLGCSAIVRTAAVCEVDRVRYCMRVNGGNIFDVLDVKRFTPYCQNYLAVLACIDKDCPANAAGNADLRLLEQYKTFLRKFCLDATYQASVVRAAINCPIFQNATVFPLTSASMACAQQLMQRQAIYPEQNLCVIVEANTYCLAQTRRCVYGDVNPQKTALLDMIGCSPAGVLQNDIVQNTATGASGVLRPSSWICLWIAFLGISVWIRKKENC